MKKIISLIVLAITLVTIKPVETDNCIRVFDPETGTIKRVCPPGSGYTVR